MSNSADLAYMQRAVALAKLGRYTTSPNPNVGCVIVKGSQVVGEGYHQKAGTPHAEVHALNMAESHAEGATAYVTLEPCSHFGRTPPCCQALIKAKVTRVVVGMLDPNPLVAGNGIKALKDAGIEVEVGVLEPACEALNPGFLFKMRNNRPRVTCKLASSLDGATSLANGESKWITGPQARQDVQRQRALHSAVLSTAQTVIRDTASLNVRWEELGELKASYPQESLRQPVRVIIDSQKRLKPEQSLFSLPGDIILVTTNSDYTLVFPENVTTLLVDEKNEKVDLVQMMAKLAELGINDIWTEAGAKLAAGLLQEKLVDQLVLYQAPKLMGAATNPLFDFALEQMSDTVNLDITEIRKVADDIRITANVKK